MFTIDKGVPVPGAVVRTKYPFGQMEVGDSFFVPVTGSESAFAANLRASSSNWGKVNNAKFLVRFEDDGKRILRVWRVA